MLLDVIVDFMENSQTWSIGWNTLRNTLEKLLFLFMFFFFNHLIYFFLFRSCLFPLLSTYLRSVSLLDMMNTPDFYATIIKLCGGMATIPAFFPLLEEEGGGGIGSFLIKMEDSVDVIIQGSEKMNRMAKKKVRVFQDY